MNKEIQVSSTEKVYPKTLEEAVERVLSLMSEEEKKKLKNTAEKDLIKFHFGLGAIIRDECRLWKGNAALLRLCTFASPPPVSIASR